MSEIFSKNDSALGTSSPQEEPYNILGESLTNLTWLQHLNAEAIIAPCGKYDDCDEWVKNQPAEKILKLPTPADTRQYRNKSKKPPYSYVVLIALAFRYLKSDRLSVDQITEYVTKHFPYFESANVGDYIRHTMQYNKLFERVRRRKDEPYRGVFWRMSDSVVIKSDSDQEENGRVEVVTKKKRASSMFCADSFLLEDPESEPRRNKKFRSRSAEFTANSDDFDFSFPTEDCSFLTDYNWDSLLEESEETPRRGTQKGPADDDWFPAYEISGPGSQVDGKSLYDHHLVNYTEAGPGFEAFDEPKIPYQRNFYMSGYGEVADVSDFTSAIQFDPLLSTAWSSNAQGGEFGRDHLPGNGRFRFNTDGM